MKIVNSINSKIPVANTKYQRISDSNIAGYLQEQYGDAVALTSQKTLKFTPLLQKDYGGSMDCVLTSITTILNKGNPQIIYNKVEEVAKKFLYKDNIGTIPFFIKGILDTLTNKKTKRGYLKDTGYNWAVIKKLLKSNRPILLSMMNDGKNYYQSHTVTIVGYAEYNHGKIRMLKVFDNWHRSISYIDYNWLSTFSSINYI